MANKTSPCTTSVLNLGKMPRVPGAHIVDMETEAEIVLPDRDEKHTFPTKAHIMSVLSMAVILEERRAFRRRLCQASKKDERNNMEQNPCATGVGHVHSSNQLDRKGI